MTAESDRPVAVITEPDNLTADRVVLELGELGVPVVRFDLADFPRDMTLNASLSPAGWHGTLSVHGRTVALQELRAIWWWHPGPPRIALDGLCAAEAEWAREEAMAGVAGVLAALECEHVNHPSRTRAAQSKPGALASAAACGLNVPATWIGNHPGAARGFARETPGGVVGKALTRPWIACPDGTSRSLHTTPVDHRAIDSGIGLGAHQLQHRVVKDHEVRLTVVGGEMFAARIDAHSPAAREDFRADYGALTYRHTQVPDTVREGITRLMAHYGLLVAAIDLLVDEQGHWWLVDLNPAGQWDWLQKELPALPLAQAMAELLASGRPTAKQPAVSPAVPGPQADLSLCPERQITVTEDGVPFISTPSMASSFETVVQTQEDMQIFDGSNSRKGASHT
ncbi:MvdC/MvdD family ATP grasp protein [Streptomyces sp. NBC_01803]|uniref:MvdC/MvdD family ATP grasp protein n=1 Tax=Streptomyces sp. NBC_01803 TaxID=2975946 RepID=UPI002DD9DE7E|nr:putative ATP-grasp-modified RiPP [Streptomyces sp. NBC_01803]WSA43048.1 putative ATP-grasp-modified RiPP [Streptomyces sp. NBC_01803]